MKKNRRFSFIIILLFCFGSTYILSAQVVLRETSLKQQIEKSSLVVEGKIISKKSFWSNNVIYTANTLEVYKVFKGELISTLDILTLGGTVGLQALNVSSSLKLNKGDVGVFALENIKDSKGASTLNTQQFKPYGAIQGFYKYNLDADIAVNPFHIKKGISDSFYNEIMNLTKTVFKEVSSFNIKAIQSKSIQSKNLLAPSEIAFGPTSISAGTKETIIITIPGGNTGTDFGATKGKVAFSNADDGGATFIDALDSQVTWSTTFITVEVPAEAGTGRIRVTNADSSSRISDIDLTITYAESNVVYDEDDRPNDMPPTNGPLEPKAYQIQHINENGSGGYTFQMHTDFNANTLAKESFERAFEKWRCTTKINWIFGATTSVDAAEFESAPVQPPAMSAPSVSVVRFDNGFELDTDVLGTCYSWYKGCSLGGGDFAWFVAEMDVVFDDGTMWNYGTGATVSGQYDFESVALHELGHGHQLGHVIDDVNNGDNMDDVMHYALLSNEDQRVLSDNNIIAANAIQSRSTVSSTCGESPMTNYLGSCSLGFETNELNASIELYPNPTQGEFYINNERLVNLQSVVIYDVSGRLISQQDISSASPLIVVYLNGVSKGVYFVNIQSGNKTITKKIVLE
jgi:hypothetical protein